MANIPISKINKEASSINNNDLLIISQPDSSVENGYVSAKVKWSTVKNNIDVNNIEYLSQSEYDSKKAAGLLDPSKYYATPVDKAVNPIIDYTTEQTATLSWDSTDKKTYIKNSNPKVYYTAERNEIVYTSGSLDVSSTPETVYAYVVPKDKSSSIKFFTLKGSAGDVATLDTTIILNKGDQLYFSTADNFTSQATTDVDILSYELNGIGGVGSVNETESRKASALASFNTSHSRCVATTSSEAHQSFEFLTVKDKDNNLHKVLLKLGQSTNGEARASVYSNSSEDYYPSTLKLYELVPYNESDNDDKKNRSKVNAYDKTDSLYSNDGYGYILPHQGFSVPNKYIELDSSNKGNIIMYCGCHPSNNHARNRDLLKITLPIQISSGKVKFFTHWNDDNSANGIIYRHCTVDLQDNTTDDTFGYWNRHPDLAINPENNKVHLILNNHSRINHFFIKSFQDVENCFNDNQFSGNIHENVSNIQHITNKKLEEKGVQSVALDNDNFYYMWSDTTTANHEIYLVSHYGLNPNTFIRTLRSTDEGTELLNSDLYYTYIENRIIGHERNAGRTGSIVYNFNITRTEGESLFWVPEIDNKLVYHLCMGVTVEVEYDYIYGETAELFYTTDTKTNALVILNEGRSEVDKLTEDNIETVPKKPTIACSFIYDLMNNGNKLLIEN